jgi:putative FmdB family regulatory protein
MPIYEYQCTNYGHQVEVLVRTGGDVPLCPDCGSSLHERLLSAPYVMSGQTTRQPGHTCCGREERRESPLCSSEGGCRRASHFDGLSAPPEQGRRG